MGHYGVGPQMMWGDADHMLATCEQWMTANPRGSTTSTELVQLDGDLDDQPHRQLDRPGQLGRLDDAWLDDGWLTQHQP